VTMRRKHPTKPAALKENASRVHVLKPVFLSALEHWRKVEILTWGVDAVSKRAR